LVRLFHPAIGKTLGVDTLAVLFMLVLYAAILGTAVVYLRRHQAHGITTSTS
jgi:hypothetical protein